MGYIARSAREIHRDLRRPRIRRHRESGTQRRRRKTGLRLAHVHAVFHRDAPDPACGFCLVVAETAAQLREDT